LYRIGELRISPAGKKINTNKPLVSFFRLYSREYLRAQFAQLLKLSQCRFTGFPYCNGTRAGYPRRVIIRNQVEINGHTMIRIIIADDHNLVREGIKALLAQRAEGVEITGEASEGRQVIELLEKRPADLVLMDVDMPGMNGIEATGLIKERFPDVKVLMLTMMDNEHYLSDALRAGATGYVLKSAGHQELLHAIDRVAGGEEYFSADVVKMLLRKSQPAPARDAGALAASGGQAMPQPPPTAISPREVEVLRLIAQGYTNAQIAEMLFNSRRTIETHRQNLLEKTGANNTATLILYAVSHGLLE
jgi:DNA-binding NarL/FixJ family response regulator